MGCDLPSMVLFGFIVISIHAPLMGCDENPVRSSDRSGYFNPRTPHGVRPVERTSFTGAFEFQSTHPSWGATTVKVTSTADIPVFQSTHPSWGATGVVPVCSIFFILFQSTHPSWGATSTSCHSCTMWGISIHAPLMGCDPTPASGQTKSFLISIHAPLMGCDSQRELQPQDLVISIHAPLMGCDYNIQRLHFRVLVFQSTHPSWGATRIRKPLNPRRGISIHAPLMGCDGKLG